MRPRDRNKYNEFENDNFEREEAYLRAKKKLDKLIGFYWHLASYIVVNIFIIILIMLNRDPEERWHWSTFSTAFFWGIGLIFHFLGVFGPDLIFGKNWEEEKIKEYMDRDKRNWE
ncbi:MAG: hypothetical protein BM564_09855 [Bacteroidetes bacterium MedPE-SWsnd-G2]|nr:MAG: hypothetical protein BM564_09855 [Bacteroidetes bacterium MedPE-SWsnd-G2]